MDLSITVENTGANQAFEPEEELRSLASWLRTERVAGAEIRSHQAPKPGELGSALEIVRILVGDTGAAPILAASLAVWLRTRRKDLKLKITRDDGLNCVVEAKGVSDPQPIIEQFLKDFGTP